MLPFDGKNLTRNTFDGNHDFVDTFGNSGGEKHRLGIGGILAFLTFLLLHLTK